MNPRVLFAMFAMLVSINVSAKDDIAPIFEKDPHRNELGFFDIHICNWPDRPLFFKTLFSTTKFKNIESMEVFSVDGKKVVDLDLRRFKQIEKKGKPVKRVYMVDHDVPTDSKAGWYYIVVKTKDGKEYRAKDYVVMNRLALTGGQVPADEAEDVKMPTELKWAPVPGASHYQIYVRDGFENNMVLRSKLVTEPRIKIKPGTFKPGGYYTWKIHARDVNENIILGDFNSGSTNKRVGFFIADE